MTGREDPFVERPAAGSAPGHVGAAGHGPPGYGPPPPGSPAAAYAGGYGPPQGQGRPGWGPPVGAAPETSSKAIVALVLSICSFVVFPFVPAVVALVLARTARLEIAQSRGQLAGDGLTRAAVIVSWINIALSLVVLVALAGLVAVAVSRSS